MIVEWLVRKLFRIKHPATREIEAAEAEAADQSPRSKTEDERVEPRLGDVTEVMANSKPDAPASKRSLPPLTATPDMASMPRSEQMQVGGTASPGAPAGETIPPSGTVNIFNFKAWFLADPVKASLTLGLAFLSWLATYTGMLELIQANTGALDIGARIAIGFAVMMLMLMILYLLDSLYNGSTPHWLKPVFVAGYLFLTLISVGFGFGFYWKYLEAQTEATRSAESAVSQVQVALEIGQTRLEQLQNTFAQLTKVSTEKATQEREFGNSCPNSRPGEGPRMRLRDSDAQKFAYAAQYITGTATTVNTDIAGLNADLKKVVSRDPSTIGADGTRNKFMRELGRKLDRTIARFNTLRTDPQLQQFRENFHKRANTTIFPNGKGGNFRCPDVQLQTALRGVVRAIDDIPEIKNPKIAAVEGSEAIVEAFRRLGVTLAALPTLKLPPSPDELRKARKQAVSAGKKAEISNIDPGLSKRDYIPLSAAVFVDLCILLISLNRNYDRWGRFKKSIAIAKAGAEAGEIGNTMLEIFEAHQNRFSEEMLEIFHHAEFEFGRDYYLAVPLVKGSTKALYHQRLAEKDEAIRRSKMEALQERVNIYEMELHKRIADQVEAERTKRQITDFINSLTTNRAKLLHANKNLALGDKTPPHDQEIVKRAKKADEQLQEIDNHITDFNQKLAASNRILKGTTELVKQARADISDLKQQQSLLHEEEKDNIRRDLDMKSELRLAREARFLSNLCISLEANDILHLSSIWPFQRQVRAQLKKHKSRYFEEGRHYRVYRFRRVADTQSQMVLDLIMEAAKRARENGDLRAEEAHGAAAGVPAAVEAIQQQLEIEREDIRQRERELEAAREAFEEPLHAMQQDLDHVREMLKENQQQAGFQRDPNVEEATIIDPEKLRARTSDSEHVDKARQVRNIAAKIGEEGLGATMEEVAQLMNARTPGEADVALQQAVQKAKADPAGRTRKRRSMFDIGGLFGLGRGVKKVANEGGAASGEFVSENVIADAEVSKNADQADPAPKLTPNPTPNLTVVEGESESPAESRSAEQEAAGPNMADPETVETISRGQPAPDQQEAQKRPQPAEEQAFEAVTDKASTDETVPADRLVEPTVQAGTDVASAEPQNAETTRRRDQEEVPSGAATSAELPDDPRDRVNFHSLPGLARTSSQEGEAPKSPMDQEGHSPVDVAVASLESRQEGAERETSPISAEENRMTSLQQKISGIAQQLSMGTDSNAGNTAPSKPKTQETSQPSPSASEGTGTDTVRLTQPVTADTANNLNKDPGDVPGRTADNQPDASEEPLRAIRDDEPSEADTFREGKMPGFLKGADSLEEMGEENGAKFWAERLSKLNPKDE